MYWNWKHQRVAIVWSSVGIGSMGLSEHFWLSIENLKLNYMDVLFSDLLQPGISMYKCRFYFQKNTQGFPWWSCLSYSYTNHKVPSQFPCIAFWKLTICSSFYFSSGTSGGVPILVQALCFLKCCRKVGSWATICWTPAGVNTMISDQFTITVCISDHWMWVFTMHITNTRTPIW